MKLKFRAEKKDLIAFITVIAFMLYLVAIIVLNIKSIIQEGTPWGLNPIPAFFPNNIVTTFVFWFGGVLILFTSTSNYFFSREKGSLSFTFDPKEDGYSRWAKPKEIETSSKVVKVPYSSKKTEAGGVPLVYDKDGVWVDNSEYHTLVLGATGSGKTAGIINPTMKMLMKARESIIISDPKGEIFENNSGLLRELGYEIIVLNFREPQKGNAWNPYHLPYKFQKEGNFDKANELLNDLSTNIVVDGQGQDPFWQDSAASYLTGLSLALFEDAKEDEININSVNLMMTVGDERYKGPSSTYLKEYFNAKDPSSPACVNALGTVNAPNDTKGGIVSVLKQKVKTLAVTKNLSEMLANNDFEMDSIGEKPTAVFMIIQDEKTTYHSLATIFVKQCYESLISNAHKHGGQLPVRVNFLLDEFANMPKFKDITTMVTAARSRRIKFLFIIQNFAQLKQVYGDHDAETIRGNCGNIIYLLTGELAALEEISKLCGDKIVKVGKDKKEETRPLVTISELQRMKDNEIILIRHRCPPFKGKIKKDYESDFGFGIGAEHYGKNVIYPSREMSEIKMFDLKAFVQNMDKAKNSNNVDASPFSSPFGGSSSPFGGSSPFGNSSVSPMGDLSNASEFDIDKMIKEIDAEIARLEAEEKEEKRKLEKESSVENTSNDIKTSTSNEEISIDSILSDADVSNDLNNKSELVEDIKPKDSTPNIEEVVHSNMVNLKTFEMKDKEIEQPKNVEETVVDEKKKEEILSDNNDFDDFFDDFFFED